jgi:hypothetical protein
LGTIHRVKSFLSILLRRNVRQTYVIADVADACAHFAELVFLRRMYPLLSVEPLLRTRVKSACSGRTRRRICMAPLVVVQLMHLCLHDDEMTMPTRSLGGEGNLFANPGILSPTSSLILFHSLLEELFCVLPALAACTVCNSNERVWDGAVVGPFKQCHFPLQFGIARVADGLFASAPYNVPGLTPPCFSSSTHCVSIWLTTVFSARNLQSLILLTEMPYGNRTQGGSTMPSKWATLVSFAEAISSDYSMFYILKIILPTEIPLLFQKIINSWKPSPTT